MELAPLTGNQSTNSNNDRGLKMKNKYFRIKSSDYHNNLISDVDLYQINSVLNHQYTSTDGSLPETIYFKVRYVGYQENPDTFHKTRQDINIFPFGRLGMFHRKRNPRTNLRTYQSR